MPLYFFYTKVQKSQNDQKLKSRGSCLKSEEKHVIVALTVNQDSSAREKAQTSQRTANIASFVVSPVFRSSGKSLKVLRGEQYFTVWKREVKVNLLIVWHVAQSFNAQFAASPTTETVQMRHPLQAVYK